MDEWTDGDDSTSAVMQFTNKNQIEKKFYLGKTINKTYLLLNFASSSSYFLRFFFCFVFFCFFLNLE